MRNLKKYVTTATLVISVFLIIGCGQSNNNDSTTADKANDELIKQQQAQEQAKMNQATTTTVLAWKVINAAQAENMILSDKTLQLIDVRDSNAFANKHIKGADHLALRDLNNYYTKIDKTKPVLFYDDDQRLSPDAAKFLTQKGYTNVYILNGGMATWTYQIEPEEW